MEDAYIQRLLSDLDNEITQLERPRKLSSIFIGGGTPSLLSEPAINQLFTGINKLLPLETDTECTVEANPGSSDINCFRAFQRAGVNRLSLGIQSFSDAALKQLGRVHNQAAARKAFAAARSAGFENINVDFMHGLPGQTFAAAMHDLDQAITLNSEHLSWYQLTIEPNTLFYSNKPDLPDENELWSIYRFGLEKLEQAGFQRY
jgi:oxygen-independent coproporphyrinogen-3 oxidase